MSEAKELLQVEIENRDENWESRFFAAFVQAEVKLLSPEPIEGPDHWPYLMVALEDEKTDEPVANILTWLSQKGVGLAVNPQKPTPDYVFTYGMIWNFREHGEFLSRAAQVSSGRFEIRPGQKVLAGAPSDAYLPPYVRSILKQFLAAQGVFAPKVLMVSLDTDTDTATAKPDRAFDLAISIESLKSPPAHEHANIAEALSWFLPAHYSLSLISEKALPGFQAL